jgi:hypothetical protein
MPHNLLTASLAASVVDHANRLPSRGGSLSRQPLRIAPYRRSSEAKGRAGCLSNARRSALRPYNKACLTVTVAGESSLAFLIDAFHEIRLIDLIEITRRTINEPTARLRSPNALMRAAQAPTEFVASDPRVIGLGCETLAPAVLGTCRSRPSPDLGSRRESVTDPSHHIYRYDGIGRSAYK